jgi:hypothetical protein
MISKRRRQKERGQILVLFEIVLIVILLFAALVIDIGFLRNNRQTLVNAVDSAALAGGTVLPVGPDVSPAVKGITNYSKAMDLIEETLLADYPGLTDYTIEFKCLIGVTEDGQPRVSDVPGVCDPRPSLLGNPNAAVDGLSPYFKGAGDTRFSSCKPDLGDICNVVYVTANTTTDFHIGPVVGVNQGSTGSVSSAACKGVCGGNLNVPVDAVIILDRTLSMAGSSGGMNKIQALQDAAKTVLGVYDPTQQRIALGLTGPGKITGAGDPALGNCSGYGSVYGIADDSNFSPRTSVDMQGSTSLVGETTFLSTNLSQAITSTSATTIHVTSAASFPTSGSFTIQIDTEQMLVTGGQGTTTWTVTRGYNGTTRRTHTNGAIVGWALSNAQTDNVIKVNSDSGFPSSGSFTIQVDSEQMTVTNVTTDAQGTVTWTVTRPGSGRATHGGDETASLVYSSGTTTIKVASASGFPTSGNYTIKVDNEDMIVTGGQGTTTWTVQRGREGTSAATHLGGASITRVLGSTDTQIQVDAPDGLGFGNVPFTIAVGGTSGDEHMLVTHVSGASAPYTWTVTRGIAGGNSARAHSNGETVYGADPWTPSATTVGMWIPVGLSGLDTDTPLPNPTGDAGNYHLNTSYIYKSISCISAATAGTNLATAIRMAQWYLDAYGRPGVKQGIILETDGHPQYGFSGSGDGTTTNYDFTCTAALDAANAAKADTTKSPDGIQIFTIGYGVDSNVRCPSYSSNLSQNNGNYNPYESSTWSYQQATKLLEAMASEPKATHYYENPSSSDLAKAFTQAAEELAHGGSHLIQLYPAPIVTGVGAGIVTGEYFTGASSVYFGNHPATILSVSDTSISVTMPVLPSGTTVPVTVTTPGGTSVITGASYYTFP